jgi:hypothetical protein
MALAQTYVRTSHNLTARLLTGPVYRRLTVIMHAYVLIDVVLDTDKPNLVL